MAESTRIRLTDARKRKYQHLEDATNEDTRSGALDTAADYYLRMAGGTPAVPKGAVHELMALASREGSVTPEQIAEVLDTDELPVQHERKWAVGRDE